MNKIQITIWATAEEIAMVDNKITVKKGSFYWNGKKYLIENGEIKNATNGEYNTLNNFHTVESI